jgi:hypothetical protein
MPSSPGYVRNLKAEYAGQKARGESGTGSDSENAKRHRDRSKALKLGLIKAKQDLDHKTPLSKGGSDNPSNFRGETPHQNRSFPRTSKGAMVRNVEKTKF